MTAVTQHSSLLIDSAVEMMARNGLDSLSLTDVAREAGVSRATVYREFGDKPGMISAVTKSEVGRMIGAAYQSVDLRAPLADATRDIVLFAIRYLRAHPVIGRLRDHEPHWLLNVAIDHDGASLDLIETVGAFAAPVLAARPDENAMTVTSEQAAEIAIRIVLSHVLIPRSRMSDEDIAAYTVRAIVRPGPGNK